MKSFVWRVTTICGAMLPLFLRRLGLGKLYRRTRWHGDEYRLGVEHIEIHGMGHGTPINTIGPGAVGHAAPYVLDVEIASSVELLDFWGIAAAPAATNANSLSVSARRLEPVGFAHLRKAPNPSPREQGVEKIINDALRAAGLLK